MAKLPLACQMTVQHRCLQAGTHLASSASCRRPRSSTIRSSSACGRAVPQELLPDVGKCALRQRTKRTRCLSPPRKGLPYPWGRVRSRRLCRPAARASLRSPQHLHRPAVKGALRQAGADRRLSRWRVELPPFSLSSNAAQAAGAWLYGMPCGHSGRALTSLPHHHPAATTHLQLIGCGSQQLGSGLQRLLQLPQGAQPARHPLLRLAAPEGALQPAGALLAAGAGAGGRLGHPSHRTWRRRRLPLLRDGLPGPAGRRGRGDAPWQRPRSRWLR